MTEPNPTTDHQTFLLTILTRYQSNKIAAAKIVRIIEGLDNSVGLICVSPDNRELTEIDIGPSWIARHAPDGNIHNFVGGYFVRYEDGYESWSPGDTFEKGNTAI